MNIDFFYTNPLFCQSMPATLQNLSHLARRHFYKKNTIILDHQESINNFFYILKGSAKLIKECADGQEVVVDILSQDNYSGEAWLFSAEKRESYTVCSVTDIEIFTIAIEDLKRLICADQVLTLNFLQAILEKQQTLSMSVEHLLSQTAAQRLGCFLLRRCSEPHKKYNVQIHLPYDKALLASQLGMRPETFSRALHCLSRKCNLIVKGEDIEIPDLDKLVHYVCDHCSKVFPCNSRIIQ